MPRSRKPLLPASAFDDELVGAFLRNVGCGDFARVKEQLEANPGLVNAVGPHPYWGGRPQALHVAIETNRPALVRLLLKHGADANGSNEGYLHWSPLMVTLDRRRAAMRRTLLHHGARIGLVEALMMGDDRRVARLLARGRRALPPAPGNGSLLAFARTPKAIDRLLALGVPADQPDQWGATPMEAFSRLGPTGRRLVRHMVRRGFAVLPEMLARLNDRPALARLAKTNPSALRDPAVVKAAVDFGHHPLATWLLEQGADPNARSTRGPKETALHSAAWNGDAKMVDLLLAYGANPTVLDHQYQATPAGWAETAVEVTNRPACRPLATILAQAAATWSPGEPRGNPS